TSSGCWGSSCCSSASWTRTGAGSGRRRGGPPDVSGGERGDDRPPRRTDPDLSAGSTHRGTDADRDDPVPPTRNGRRRPRMTLTAPAARAEASVTHRLRGPLGGLRGRDLLTGLCTLGQLEDEAPTAALGALRPDAAPVRFDDAPGNGQAQAEALPGLLAASLPVGFEDPLNGLLAQAGAGVGDREADAHTLLLHPDHDGAFGEAKLDGVAHQVPEDLQDRKSTRLNSSHVKISYAVFCLKKKTKHQNTLSSCISTTLYLIQLCY